MILGCPTKHYFNGSFLKIVVIILYIHYSNCCLYQNKILRITPSCGIHGCPFQLLGNTLALNFFNGVNIFILMGNGRRSARSQAKPGRDWHERKMCRTQFVSNATKPHPLDEFNEFGARDTSEEVCASSWDRSVTTEEN